MLKSILVFFCFLFFLSSAFARAIPQCDETNYYQCNALQGCNLTVDKNTEAQCIKIINLVKEAKPYFCNIKSVNGYISYIDFDDAKNQNLSVGNYANNIVIETDKSKITNAHVNVLFRWITKTPKSLSVACHLKR